MKFACECGATIFDGGDALPNRAHLLPDQAWDEVLTAIDEAIERPGHSAAAREAACMAIRTLLSEKTRLAYQCRECGRLYLEDAQRQLHAWRPETGAPSEILHAVGSRPATGTL